MVQRLKVRAGLMNNLQRGEIRHRLPVHTTKGPERSVRGGRACGGSPGPGAPGLRSTAEPVPGCWPGPAFPEASPPGPWLRARPKQEGVSPPVLPPSLQGPCFRCNVLGSTLPSRSVISLLLIGGGSHRPLFLAHFDRNQMN